MKKNSVGAFGLVLMLLFGTAFAQSGERLKRSNVAFDKKLSLTIVKVTKPASGPPTLLLEMQVKNISDNNVRAFLEGCEICFWTISVNRGKFFPLERTVHSTPCKYRNPIELEPGQCAVKTIAWEMYPDYRGLIMYSVPIRSVRVRYLAKRDDSEGPAVYLESNELDMH